MNGAIAAEEELVDYEEEEVVEGEAAKGDQVRMPPARPQSCPRASHLEALFGAAATVPVAVLGAINDG